MSRKKEHDNLISEADTQEIQHILATHQQIAEQLRNKDTVAETALQPINALPETAQLAVMKALAKLNDVEAADILAAVNALSTQKEVRKEARRSLIHLEASKTYPLWAAPITPASGIQVNIPNPPRFWKGAVSQTREEGEIQLYLVWEQGYDYSEARSLIFLLDFWNDGVKDIIVETTGKRHVEDRLAEMRAKIDAPMSDCTLAEAKRLIEEALSINAWRGTTPVKEYRLHQNAINQLIMQAAEPGRDRGKTFINPELTEQEALVNFHGGWSFGDFGLSYDLLTTDSPLREGLERSEWVEQRRNWSKEAKPARLELNFVHEREQSQQASTTLWLPSSSLASRAPLRKEVDIGWSLEFQDTPLSGVLPEMPMGTAINKDTDRHWFWTNDTIVKQDVGWRIQRISDEGATAQGLPIEELQKRIKENDAAIDVRSQNPTNDVNAFMQEVAWRLTQTLHYYDALIVRLPLDRTVCDEAYGHAVATGNPERALIYIERLASRFADNKIDSLRRLGATFATVGFNYNRPDFQERSKHFLERAETVLKEVIELDDSAINRSLYAELLLVMQRNDEAEAELLKARALATTNDEKASIEAGLGNIAMRREKTADALTYFERVAELKPNFTGIQFSIGFAHRLLGHMEVAEENYKRALVNEPKDVRPYAELIAIYMNQNKRDEARNLAAQAIRTNPDSAHLHALFASVLFELDETRQAQRELARAEELDPENEMVINVRQYVEKNKKK